MTNDPITQNKYDLEERTAKFDEEIIKFSKKIPENSATKPLIIQLVVKTETSIGANYCGADDAESKQDFKHKIGICKKEARETKHWLKMVVVAVPELKEEEKNNGRKSKN